MCKFAVNEEMLGKRVTGYMVFESKTGDFIGYTVKQIKDILAGGERVYGFILDEGGELALDTEGFKTSNLMVRSGINTLSPLNTTDCLVNLFYVVVGATKGKGGTVYEVVNSRYGRSTISENKLNTMLELEAIQGGAYLDSKGKLCICDGVRVDSPDNKSGEGVA